MGKKAKRKANHNISGTARNFTGGTKRAVKDILAGDAKGALINAGIAGTASMTLGLDPFVGQPSVDWVNNYLTSKFGLGQQKDGSFVRLTDLAKDEQDKIRGAFAQEVDRIRGSREEELRKRRNVTLLTSPGGALLTAESLSKPSLTLGK